MCDNRCWQLLTEMHSRLGSVWLTYLIKAHIEILHRYTHTFMHKLVESHSQIPFCNISDTVSVSLRGCNDKWAFMCKRAFLINVPVFRVSGTYMRFRSFHWSEHLIFCVFLYFQATANFEMLKSDPSRLEGWSYSSVPNV